MRFALRFKQVKDMASTSWTDSRKCQLSRPLCAPLRRQPQNILYARVVVRTTRQYEQEVTQPIHIHQHVWANWFTPT